MFDEIIRYTKLDYTIYVDDITISSIKREINKREESEIKTIIQRNKQKLSTWKTTRYGINEYKKESLD